MKVEDALQSLGALAQETRLAVFRLLVQAGPEGLSASEIAQRLGTHSATLSFHLKELARADLVTGRQEGRFIFYSAHYGTMNALVGYLTENCCGGRACAPVSKSTTPDRGSTHPRRKSA